jgi:hypothetical protein
MFMLRLSTLLFFYIPQSSARCREYVGEIYGLEYYFFISFSPFFYFSVYYTNYLAYLSFYQNIFI